MNNKFEVEKISINTDASFHPDHKIGGYAYYIECNHFKIQCSGIFKRGHPQNSNEAELMCIGQALQTLLERDYVPYTQSIVINTDSLNAIEDILKQESIIGKKVNTLWQNVIRRTRARKSELQHIASHTHDENAEAYINAWCDEEAKKIMKEQIG